MRILHYALGFPPYRTGGLTKYCTDLMLEQAKQGNQVSLLWPGKMSIFVKNTKVQKRKSWNGIDSFEIINPLPVPLDEGIADIDAYTKTADEEIYEDFLKAHKPDVIHIHSLMGLHKEFLTAAHKLKIRTVFTSHDYFGICPKVTLYRYGECCYDDNGCRNCIQCNLHALSLKKIQLMQSPVYRWVKDTTVVKKLRKQHRGQFFEEDVIPNMPDVDVESLAKKYRDLRAYYVGMYESIDFIHFNSTVAQEVYKRYITPKDSCVVSITHQGIIKHRIKKVDTGKKVILCLDPAKPFKGWNVLKEACDQLWAEGENIELRIYSPVPHIEPYMNVKENGFDHNELDKIMSEADVLVAPSIWYETFGFTVLEALSYGVPVIVSDHVGAKDVIGNGGIVVEAGNVEKLKNAIKCIKIDEIRKSLQQTAKVKLWTDFINENYSMYEEIK